MSSLPFRKVVASRPAPAHARTAGRVDLQMRFWTCVVLAVVIYFIAGSISSGFLFLLSSLLVAAVVIGLVYPLFAIKTVIVTGRAPKSATAGEPFLIPVVVQSGFENKFVAAMLDPQQVLIRHSFAGRQLGSSERLYEKLIECLGANKTVLQLADAGLPRGVHRLTVAISTAFPLGLVFHERQVSSDEETVVYPAIYPMEGFFLYRLPSLGSGAFGFPRDAVSRQSTFTRSLRKYVRGDSPRNIHWPSTARAGELMVREFDAEGMPYYDIVFDLTAPWKSDAQFELAVSTVASLVSLGQKMGISPDLKLTPGIEQLNLQLPASLPGFEMQMEILARVKPVRNIAAEKAQAEDEASQPVEAGNERTLKRSRERTPLVICPPQFGRYIPNSFVIEIQDPNVEGVALQAGVNRLSIHSASDLQEI